MRPDTWRNEPLFAHACTPKQPASDEAGKGDVDALKAMLTGRRGMTRSELCQALGWTTRKLRAARHAADGFVVSAPGVPGFALASELTVAEWQVYDAAWLAAISDMQQQRSRMCQAVHAGAKKDEKGC